MYASTGNPHEKDIVSVLLPFIGYIICMLTYLNRLSCTNYRVFKPTTWNQGHYYNGLLTILARESIPLQQRSSMLIMKTARAVFL
jgi:hypothetical protein